MFDIVWYRDLTISENLGSAHHFLYHLYSLCQEGINVSHHLSFIMFKIRQTTICAAICFVPPITRLLGPHVGHMNLAIWVRLRKIYVFGLEISDNQNNWKDFVGKLLGKNFVVVFYFRVCHPINLFCTPSTARHYESYTAAPDIANSQDFLMPWLTKNMKPLRRASEWCT